MNSPVFSVVICNFNYAQFVGDAIQSALDQNYPADHVQVIVVDDGSTDGSRQVYERFAGDGRFHVVLQENRGQSEAFAAGVAASIGDYICFLDSDDVFLPDKLKCVAAKLSSLDVFADKLFLCHDICIEDLTQTVPTKQQQSWFDVVGVSQQGGQLTLHDQVKFFPFSIPCGLVFSRRLIASILEALPTWAFPRGADGVICPAAFLATGSVHYLHEKLAVYRIHASNELASLANGKYVPKINVNNRGPRIQAFLEKWVDILDQPPQQRAVALDYLRRMEHLGRRLSESRELRAPVVNVVVLSDTATAGGGGIAGFGPTASLQSHPLVDFFEIEDSSLPELAQMALGYAATQGEYIIFLRRGDRLDREFVERHLFFRQHAALVGVSCSDIRLSSRQGSLIHADVFRNSGAWKQQLQQVPPLATGLKDWVAPPMSACMFRRSSFLDQLFAQQEEMPTSLREAGFWVAFHLQHHTSGVLRILETLTTCTLPDGAAASYGYLSAPSDLKGDLIALPVAEASGWFVSFYQQNLQMFHQRLPTAWHSRFTSWMQSQTANPAK